MFMRSGQNCQDGESHTRLSTSPRTWAWTADDGSAASQPGENAQACLEYETEVADRAAMHGAILHMGYHPTVRVAKARRTATLERCSLCVDEVEGIGGFLELERMVPDDTPAELIQAELAAFVAAFGVTAVRTDETYDSLVRAAQASPA